MHQQAHNRSEQEQAEPVGKIKWLIQKGWWLHSFGALAFGLGVMLFARKGLAYADKILVVLLISWLLMFVALRFIVGPANRRPGEHIARKGFRLITNYVIKQLYQQMFFFLVPLYAASTTWSLYSVNWWLAPLLLLFAVLSTMDLVFDNFIMERRKLAACMYGLAMFGVLNVMLPLVFGMKHFHGLLVAAGATAPAVALLSFPMKSVLKGSGLAITLGVTTGLLFAAYYGRAAVPPAPLSMVAGTVGHGTLSSYECLPPRKKYIPLDQSDGLRCGSILVEPGGIKSQIVHSWYKDGSHVQTIVPEVVDGCEKEGVVVRSFLEAPVEAGHWQCVVETKEGQPVGRIAFEVPKPDVTSSPPMDGGGDAGQGDGKARDANPGYDAHSSSGTLEPTDAMPASDGQAEGTD